MTRQQQLRRSWADIVYAKRIEENRLRCMANAVAIRTPVLHKPEHKKAR